MIGALFAAALAVAAPSPDAIIARYTAALAAFHSPRVLTFEYTLDQSGAKSAVQYHRVFRVGNDERDELLALDGKKLSPPTVRVFHGRRNRYTVEALAPTTVAYTFRYVGARKSARHQDFVFATVPKGAATAFRVSQLVVDGVTYLPGSIAFATTAHAGHGSIAFGGSRKNWVVTAAEAHAMYANLPSSERLSFTRYRFPVTLPSSTFAVPRPLPSVVPTP